jgi:hypothetical protein
LEAQHWEMAKLLLLAIIAAALANGLTMRSEPPLLIDPSPGAPQLDGQR